MNTVVASWIFFPLRLRSTSAPCCASDHQKRPNQQAKEVALDSSTGDFYAFDFNEDRWVAEGNVGIQKTGTGIGGVAAAILADAASAMGIYGATKKVNVCSAATLEEESVQHRCQIAFGFASTSNSRTHHHAWYDFAGRSH